MANDYTPEERAVLLNIARHTLQAITCNQPGYTVDLKTLSPALSEIRACFVTLRRRIDGLLRGCTGTLIARHPLALEVVESTIQTAFYDPRFLPVEAVEVPGLHLEISVLTPSLPLDFCDPDDLCEKLRPCIDGVTLKIGTHRATFLPQVWETYPDPCVFLALLCEKMGRSPDTWKSPGLQVETYQAIIIEEDE
jgi:hypothetical protein